MLGTPSRRGLVAQNVAAGTTIDRDKRRRRRLEVGVDVPTPVEVRALLEAADQGRGRPGSLAALAGLRASEIRGLPWSDVDLGLRPAVTIAQRADQRAHDRPPKSREGRRTVPLGERPPGR